MIPNQVHYTSETNPTFVKHSELYRITSTALVEAGTPLFEDIQEELDAEHPFRRSDGYGVVWFESEEHSILHLTSTERVARWRETGEGIDLSAGVNQDRWPNTGPWKAENPTGTWHNDGQGILGYIDHPQQPDGIVVYEYHGKWPHQRDDEPDQPLVTFHCTVCHLNTFAGGEVYDNTDATRRRWAGRKARQHARSAERYGVGTIGDGNHGECFRMGRAFGEAIAAVTDTPYMEDASDCAASGPCATIRHLKAKEVNK